jgi:hypothetical protein
MTRKEYNNNVLNKCLSLLKSRSEFDVYAGVILAAYIIEQSFKSELKMINPLLLYVGSRISGSDALKIATNSLPTGKVIKTINASKCVEYICNAPSNLSSHKPNIKRLFQVRNMLLHSIDDIPETSIAEIAISALRACRDHINEYCNLDFAKNPLSSKEFEQLQKQEREKIVQELKELIGKHKSIFDGIPTAEVKNRNNDIPKLDPLAIIHTTGICPACGQESFDEIITADFEYGPDGELESEHAFTIFRCRVCELELDGYDYEIVRTIQTSVQ